MVVRGVVLKSGGRRPPASPPLVVVCRPLHARGYISLRRTRCSLLAVFLLSAVVNFPRLLRYSVVTQSCLQLQLPISDNNRTDHCQCVLYTKVKSKVDSYLFVYLILIVCEAGSVS